MLRPGWAFSAAVPAGRTLKNAMFYNGFGMSGAPLSNVMVGRTRKRVKTQCFYTFVACPSLRARRENQSKIIPNARLDRVARRIIFESCFFTLRSFKMESRRVSGASLGALERLLGRSWALLGALGALLGRSWGALGALLGALGRHLGGTWDALRTLWAAS